MLYVHEMLITPALEYYDMCGHVTYVCFYVQEMLITPALLDFLEQALEPIPMMQLMQSRQTSKICECCA